MTGRIDGASVGVALIGAGMIARRHVEALSATAGRLRLEAVVSRRPERAEPLAEHYAGPRPLFTSDLSLVTGNPDVRVAIVATPPSVRIEPIEALARAGKHVLLEKPVARNVEEAVRVVEVCERAGVVLGVLFQHRVRAASRAAAELLAGGELGDPGLVEIAVPLWRPQSYYDELGRGTYARDGGGVLITQAIHTIDLALALVGPVARVQAMTATTPLHRMEAEDFAVAGLHFASGAVGSLVASTATFPHGRETIAVHCAHGSLRLGPETLEVSRRDGRSERDGPAAEGAHGDGPAVARHEWHRAVIEDFVEAVERGRQPMVSGRAALAPHRLIEAIEASSRTGTAVPLEA